MKTRHLIHLAVCFGALALVACRSSTPADFAGTPNPLDSPGTDEVSVDTYGETQGRFAPNWEVRRMAGLYGR